MAANPCVVIDEIEKSGTSRHNGNLQDALVPMLEPATSRSILDTGIELPVDISQVSYLATANGLDGITSPLLDRLRVLTTISDDLASAAHELDIAVDRAPVSAVGRTELPHWVREQAISETTHRYGLIRP